MTTRKQKSKEVHHLEDFRALFSDFPEGSVVPSERPDFILRTNESIIGIEFTALYAPPSDSHKPIQAQVSERRLLLQATQRILDQMGSSPVNVSVQFANDTGFSKHNRAKYATILAQLVRSQMPLSDPVVSIVNQYASRDSFPFEFESIHISPFGSQHSSSFSMTEVGVIFSDFEHILQDAINEKDRLLMTYQKCSSYWLVIVADWSAPSSFFSPSHHTLTTMYHSSFNRVFFLNIWDHQLDELPVITGAR